MNIEFLDVSRYPLDDSLMNVLSRITAQGFMQPLSLELKGDVRNHVLSCQTLFLLRDGEIGAYAAVSKRHHSKAGDICHLEGIMVNTDLQGTGAGKRLLAGIIDQVRAPILALHTQSKRMEGLANTLCDSDTGLALLVAGLIGTRNLVVLKDGPIDRGRYGQCLYGDQERFRQIEIVRTGFDAQAGDAIVYAGRVRQGGKE